MSIVGQVLVEGRRYSGWTDPRYPIGYWMGALTVIGNASGGVVGIDLLFQQANGGDRLNSQIYNVERIGMFVSNATTRVIRLAGINMGGPSNQGFTHEYSITIAGQTGQARAAIAGDMSNFMPLFLGSQRSAGVSTSLSAVFPNLDLDTYTFEAEGYRWSPRSVLVDGGPQRPPTGPYGR